MRRAGVSKQSEGLPVLFVVGDSISQHYGPYLRQMVSVAFVCTSRPGDDARHNSQVAEFHRRAADVDAYHAAADRIMAENHVPVVDLYGFTRNLGPGVYCDHVHFTEPVRQMQAGYVAGWLAGMRLSHVTLADRLDDLD
jgi:hypothetical protein